MIAAHTIQDEWLLSYAAGALSPARSLLVASHSAYHDSLQEKVADAEAIGGAMLEAMGSNDDVDPRVLERLLDRLDETPAEIPTPRADSIFPAPLAEFVGTDEHALKWRFMGPGVSHVRLWDGPQDERLWLLRAKPGMQMPEHGHSGDEWTLVLKGAFDTKLGRFGVGDMDVADDSIEHQPLIEKDEDCICLVLTSGPLRFNSLAARAVQPFIGL
ncbi:MAG: ChrR family anti-sigma-E factor [Gammaproteobacteria bacterium]